MFSAERQTKMGNVNSKEQEIRFSTEFFPSETGECNIAVHTWRPAAGQSARCDSACSRNERVCSPFSADCGVFRFARLCFLRE